MKAEAAVSNDTIKVIIIDDIPLVADGIEYALSKVDDIELIGRARTTRHAMTLLLEKRSEIDLALVDLNLKEKVKARPLELCREIRRDFPNIPILVYTIYDGKRLIMQLKKLGVKGYLSKNYQDDQLVEAIRCVNSGKLYFPENEGTGTTLGINARQAGIDEDVFEKLSQLTTRETEVCERIVQGKNIGEIALDLGISEHTVNIHRDNLYKKMEVNSAHQLTVLLGAKF